MIGTMGTGPNAAISGNNRSVASFGNSAGGTSTPVIVHSATLGRDITNQHPALAISFTPTIYTLGNNVQDVLSTVGDEVDRQNAFNEFNSQRDFTIYPNEQMNVIGVYTINTVVTIEGILNQIAL
jgi:hypothetical protein